MKPDGRCRSCDAPIAWAVTSSGRRMPLDPEPHPDGNVVSDGRKDGALRVSVFGSSSDVPAQQALRYRSHFVTCPNADEHRRDR